MAFTADEIAFLAQRAGLKLTQEQKTKLAADAVGVMAASERVHGERPFSTEPVVAFSCPAEDEA